MARLLALDWDRVEARMVLARTQGSEVRIEQFASVPLILDAQESNLEGLQKELSKALASQRFPKSQALVAMGRSLIELRTLKLPPAPDDELPEMVRFQAMREFSSLKDASPLDFVPLKEAAIEPGEVMAAAIPVELAQQVEAALTEQGHELHRSAMRPCAAASLAMRRRPQSATGVTLVIAQQADSAELAVTRDGTVVFTRSFRLPNEWRPGETGEPLVGEVRRTIAAAQNQLGAARVEQIVYFGNESEYGALRDRLQDRTQLDVSLVNPLEGVTVVGTAPDYPERFAAALGMLHDEAQNIAPVIDFKHPRKKPTPKSNRRLHGLIAATAATAALGVCSLIYLQFSNLDQELEARKRTINHLSRENKKFVETIALVDELTKWKSADHNWLDEFVHLSTSKELAAEDFRIESLIARAREGFPGMMEVNGRAKDLTAQQKLQNELSDDFHDVLPGLSTRADDDDERYPMVFTTTIRTTKSMEIELPRPEQAPSEATTPADKAAEPSEKNEA